MSLRVPPGRSGRLWLRQRLSVARRASQILEQKHAALLQERTRLERDASTTRAAWETAHTAAAALMLRAQLIAGEQHLEAARTGVREPADVRVSWRQTMGVAYPVDVVSTLPPPAAFATRGGSAAVAAAATAYRAALQAGARHAVIATALARVRAEADATAHRQRVIDHRWIPLLSDALRSLRHHLDEAELEETGRMKWISQRTPGNAPRP